MDIFGVSRDDSVKSSQSPTPEWVKKMQKDYRETRTYRASDVIRILGNQTVAVQGSSKHPSQ